MKLNIILRGKKKKNYIRDIWYPSKIKVNNYYNPKINLEIEKNKN